MHAVGVIGPREARRTAATRLVDRLAADGRVAVVTGDTTGGPGARFRDAGASVACGLGADGWVAAGPARTLDETLDRLARDCDYAVVLDRPDATLPQVVVGDAAAEDVLAAAPSADDLDLDAVASVLAEREPRETLASLVERATAAPESEYAGAVATFTGRVRPREDPEDAYTEHLEFEKYDAVAERRLAAIRSDLEARDGVYRVLLHHRTGVVRAEADIVHVVVLAGHRAEAFETVEDGIDRLKAEVPLFKKEVTVEEAFWAHERDGAQSDVASEEEGGASADGSSAASSSE